MREDTKELCLPREGQPGATEVNQGIFSGQLDHGHTQLRLFCSASISERRPLTLLTWNGAYGIDVPAPVSDRQPRLREHYLALGWGPQQLQQTDTHLTCLRAAPK